MVWQRVPQPTNNNIFKQHHPIRKCDKSCYLCIEIINAKKGGLSMSWWEYLKWLLGLGY